MILNGEIGMRLRSFKKLPMCPIPQHSLVTSTDPLYWQIQPCTTVTFLWIPDGELIPVDIDFHCLKDFSHKVVILIYFAHDCNIHHKGLWETSEIYVQTFLYEKCCLSQAVQVHRALCCYIIQVVDPMTARTNPRSIQQSIKHFCRSTLPANAQLLKPSLIFSSTSWRYIFEILESARYQKGIEILE